MKSLCFGSCQGASCHNISTSWACTIFIWALRFSKPKESWSLVCLVFPPSVTADIVSETQKAIFIIYFIFCVKLLHSETPQSLLQLLSLFLGQSLLILCAICKGSDLVLFLLSKSYDAHLSTMNSSCANAESFRQISSLCWRRDTATNSRLTRLLTCGEMAQNVGGAWQLGLNLLFCNFFNCVPTPGDTKSGSPAVCQNKFFWDTSVQRDERRYLPI